MYRTVDLFAGCGGMSLGFQKAGYSIIAAYDIGNQQLKHIEKISITPYMKEIWLKKK